MSDLVTNLNTLTTKVAALRTKVKDKAVASDATVADTDTISQIVDKIVSFSRIKLTNSYKYVDSLNNYISNICDFSNITDMSRMFKNCLELTSIPLFDTSRAVRMNEFFYGCAGITTIPNFDTSNNTNFSYMFYGCTNLTTIPLLDMSKSGASIIYMFFGCTNLTTIPLLDFSKITDFTCAFQNCSKLSSLPDLDFSNAIGMYQCFNECSSLATLPAMNTTKATNLQSLCHTCTSLTMVTQIDVQSATNMMYIFYKCQALQYIKILNFGKQSDVNVLNAFVGTIWGQGSGAARQSLIDSLLTNSFDRRTAGYAPLTVQLPSASLALLKSNEKAAITAKGYTLTA